MIKLLLVDDESATKRYLRSALSHNEFDIEIVGEAENGVEALKKIETFRPEIIITDVRMPLMDGLELCRNIKEKNYDCQTIIISAYQEFEYAKKAIQYGVKEYLLKPIDKEKLINTVSMLANQINFRRSEINSILSLKDAVITYKKEKLKDNLLMYLQGIEDTLEDHSIIEGLIKNYYRCMILNGQNGYMSMQQVEEALAVIFEYKFPYFYLYNKFDGQVCIFIDENDFDKAIKCKFRGMLGISSAQRGERGLRLSYKQAVLAALGNFYSLETGIIEYNQLRFKKLEDFSWILDSKMKLKEWITVKEKNQYSHFVEELIFVFTEKNINPAQVYKIIFELFFSLEVEMDMSSYSSEFIEISLKDISNCRDIKEIKDFTLERIERIIDATQYKKIPVDNITKRAKEYIKSNYVQEITLENLADTLHISKYHLSRVFKKNTGKTVWDYITYIRIEEAKKLLADGKYKIYEIAERIGYSNASYFSSIFKSVTGINATEYKNSNI